VKEAVLFDLGNTLVKYYERSEFPAILEQAILEVRDTLQDRGWLSVSLGDMWQRVSAENYEAEDHRTRPLEGRLARIFQLDPDQPPDVIASICRCFLKPIFARGRCYEDSLPVLRGLKSRGLRTAIASNTPWGSPGFLWREELERLGLSEWLDVIVFCADVGWRKPALPIFQFTLEQLKAKARDCLFVGDDPRWDLAGPRAMGMDAILIDRSGVGPDAAAETIHTLYELCEGQHL
jgi:putative hydrolase of the HAD superfamily